MPGLRRYDSELSQYVTNTYSKLGKRISDHDTIILKCSQCLFITNSTAIMERHKSEVHGSFELQLAYPTDNSKLFSSEKSTSEKDLEIEVLDIDEFGIFPNAVEVDDNGYSDLVNNNQNNDFEGRVHCSSPEREESTSFNVYDKNFVKSQVRNYKCRHCGHSTRNSREYLHHLHDVHNEIFPIHECHLCEYASKHIKNLERHCFLIHRKVKENKAESRKSLAPESKKSLAAEFKKSLPNSVENSKEFEKLHCSSCTFSTTSERIFSVHVACHYQSVEEGNVEVEDLNSTKFSTVCNGIETEECKPAFNTVNKKIKLINHSNSHTPKSHKCPFCKMNLRWISWLIRHLRQNHSEITEAETLAAAYEVKSKRKTSDQKLDVNALQISKNVDISGKPTSPLISSSFSNCSQMNFDTFSSVASQHLSNNYSEIPYTKSHVDVDNSLKCNLCFQKFEGILELQQHMQVHPNPTLDTLSDSDFGLNIGKRKKYNFNNINTEIGEQSAFIKNVRTELSSRVSSMAYQCPYCSFSIKSVSRFHIHFIQHMKNLLFKCSDCDYHSNWKWTVIKHIWSKICNERNHFNAYVSTNNELVDINNFKLYKKYLVNFNQFKTVNYQMNTSHPTTVQRKNSWFQPAKFDILSNDGNNVDFSTEIAITPSLSVNSPKETNYYYCKECSFRSINKQIVINHLAVHAGIKPFQCSVCDLKSRWRHVIVRHMKNVHTGKNVVIGQKINFVQEGFNLYHVFENDKNYEHLKSSECLFNCHICPYKTSKEFHLNFHMKQHKYREGVKYKCDKCPYFVKFSKSLIKHKKLHNSPTDYTTGIVSVDNKCVEEFKSSLNVEKSTKKYFRKKLLACMKCPARFSQQDRFARHLELHGKNYKFKCNQCDFSVQGAVNLVKHKRLHELKMKQEYPGSSKPYACSICPAVFSLKVRYQRHLKLHNKNYRNQYGFNVQRNVNFKSKKFHSVKRKLEFASWSKSLSCPKCPTLFSSQERYTRHLELHGKDYKFTCSQCDYSVQNAVNIRRHEKIHNMKMTPEHFDIPIYSENSKDADKVEEPAAMEIITNANEKKLYICDRCPYYSVSKTAVQSHQRSHWLNQGSKCPHCDYRSLHRNSLQSHLKLHLEGSKLFSPQAFMKFQSFKIYIQEENGEKLVFDDEIMVNQDNRKSETEDDVFITNGTIEDNQNNQIKHIELTEITKNHADDIDETSVPTESKSDKDSVAVLTNIFDNSCQ